MSVLPWQQDFDDSSWAAAAVLESVPTAKLSSPMMQPVRKVQTYTAIGLSEPAPGVYVFDFGQNMVSSLKQDTDKAQLVDL